MIISDATDEAILTDLPALIAEGHASIKLFMTYDRLKVDDENSWTCSPPRAATEPWFACMPRTMA